jgi:hypothetical protein
MAFGRILRTRKSGAWPATGTIVIASLVLAGWTFDIDRLKRVAPGLIAMNPVTALAFLLSAFSLLLFSNQKSGHTSDCRFQFCSGSRVGCKCKSSAASVPSGSFSYSVRTLGRD